MASPNPYILEITIISAKHLKNVNWRNGDLKPYATVYLDNNHRLATRADDTGSTKPIWNERFTLPVTRPVRESVLTVEIFHSKPSETPKPLVGSAKFPLSQLADNSDESSVSAVVTLDVILPSGRSQGRVRVKLCLKEVPLPPPPVQDYHNTPAYSHYYNPAPPYNSYAYSEQYGGYYPAQIPRPLYNRPPNYSLPSGPSAPVAISMQSSSYYEQKPSPAVPFAPVDYNGKVGGAGLSGAMGGLSIEEGRNNEKKEKVEDRESHGYSGYQREY